MKIPNKEIKGKTIKFNTTTTKQFGTYIHIKKKKRKKE